MPDDVEDHATLNNSTTEGDQAHKTTWRALFGFTRRDHICVLLTALLFSLASGIAIPALAIFLGKLFNLITGFGAGHLSGRDLVAKTSTYGLYLVALGCASAVLNAGYFGFWVLFGELQAKAVRDRLFDGLLEKDMEWFDMRKAGANAMVQRLQTYGYACQVEHMNYADFLIDTFESSRRLPPSHSALPFSTRSPLLLLSDWHSSMLGI